VAIAEGIRASLTCPLISSGITIGFLFVSSNIPGIYTEEHQRVVSRLARRLTLFIERGRLLSTLAEQKRTIDLQRAELQQAVLNNTKVLGSVAHDLRNQLGNIVVMSQLLKDDRDPIRNQMFLGEINQTATSALQSVDDLIDAAQISAGKFKLNRESIALMPILTAAISRNAPLAAQRKSHMDIATIGLVVNIFVDPLKLRQVFDNLLNNALRYSPSGTRVSIGIAHEFGVYKLYISDNGPGIPAGELSHLFKPFSRLPTPPLGSPGIGLGLYLVKSVIEAHGGTVGVDSIVGKGSVFWFTLPDTN
jgi:signal transduction histidine kinase